MTRPAAAMLGPADAYVTEVLSLLGAHAHAINALLTVSSVEWSDDITTACVECVERPRLLLNPAFVQRWCYTPERLAALLMHELLHIALGHTRLFPRPTAAHNIAFDAIINRTVIATVHGTTVDVDEYTGLFTEFYSANTSPCFILRPPPGWPANPNWDASNGLPSALRAIHRTLYDYTPQAANEYGVSTHTAPPYTQVTYGDIIAALLHSDDGSLGTVQLLGAHGASDAEQQAIAGTRDSDAAEALATALAAIVGQLPGKGDHLGLATARDAQRTPALERALRTMLQHATQRDGTSNARWSWHERALTTVHRARDRRAACRVRAARALGAPAPLLFHGHMLERKPDRVCVTIYVDVSGSMNDLLPHLRRALLSLRREVQPTLFWFSNTVVPAQEHDLDRGQFPSTGGTEIGAVIAHAAKNLSNGSRALVLTDGYVEQASAATCTALNAANISLHVGVLGQGPLHLSQPWVASSIRLPSPGL